MVADSANSKAIGFSECGKLIEIRDTNELLGAVIGKYFRTTNFHSLARQLNNYRFQAVPPSRSDVKHCYLNEFFQRGRMDLLSSIKKPKDYDSQQSSKNLVEETIGNSTKELEESQQLVKRLRLDLEKLEQEKLQLELKNKILSSRIQTLLSTCDLQKQNNLLPPGAFNVFLNTPPFSMKRINVPY